MIYRPMYVDKIMAYVDTPFVKVPVSYTHLDVYKRQIDKSAEVIAIENSNVLEEIQKNEVIFIGYPTQFYNAPYMVRDFIKKNAGIWKHKKILCLSLIHI